MSNVFEDYFEKRDDYKPVFFDQKDIVYCSDLNDFYDKVIKQHIEELYVNKHDNLLKWCEFIKTICEVDIPIYWIRKYESSTPYGKIVDEKGNTYDKRTRDRKWNTRRGALTLVTDENNEVKYGYIFVSNYDAQEIYNMVLNIENPDPNEFLSMMKNGKYQLHWDNGGSCVESMIPYYDDDKCLNVKDGGILTQSKWYLAHINDVNGEYYENGKRILSKIYRDKIQKYFPSGDSPLCVDKSVIKNTQWGVIKDWKEINNANKNVVAFLGKDSVGKKVRIIRKDSKQTDFDFEKKIFKAHFLRFIHPFNYFLVPAGNYVFNSFNNLIGEYSQLINLVNNKIVSKINEIDDLKEYYLYFYKNIMLKDSNSIINSFNVQSFEKTCDGKIHILYGLNLEIKKEIEKFKKSKFNVDENQLFNVINNYDKDKHEIEIIFEDGQGESSEKTKFTKKPEFVDLVKRIKEKYKKTEIFNTGDDEINVTINLIDKPEVNVTDRQPKPNSSKKTIPVSSKKASGLINPQTKTVCLSKNGKKNCFQIECGSSDGRTFDSKDKTVATVDTDGKVTCLKPGEVDITVQFSNGKSDVCKVTVYDGPKAGEYAHKIFYDLLSKHSLNQAMIDNLLNKDYCSKQFGINFSILTSEKHPKYYAKPIEGYYLCSQWVFKHIEKIKKWLEDNKLKS